MQCPAAIINLIIVNYVCLRVCQSKSSKQRSKPVKSSCTASSWSPASEDPKLLEDMARWAGLPWHRAGGNESSGIYNCNGSSNMNLRILTIKHWYLYCMSLYTYRTKYRGTVLIYNLHLHRCCDKLQHLHIGVALTHTDTSLPPYIHIYIYTHISSSIILEL